MSRSQRVIQEKIFNFLQFLHEIQEPCYVYELEKLYPSMNHKTIYIPIMKELGYIETVGKMKSRQWWYVKGITPTMKDAKLISDKATENRLKYKKQKVQVQNKIPEIKFDRIGKKQIYDWLIYLSKVKEAKGVVIKKETGIDLQYIYSKSMLDNNIIGKKRCGSKDIIYFIKTEVKPNIHMVNKIFDAGQKLQLTYGKDYSDKKIEKIKSELEQEYKNNMVEELYTIDDFKNHIEILKQKLFNATGISTELVVRFTNEFKI